MACTILTRRKWNSAHFAGERLLIQSDQPVPADLDELTLGSLGLDLPGMFLADAAAVAPDLLELLTLEVN